MLPIPEDMADELGIRVGSEVRLERHAGGGLLVRPPETREGAGTRLFGLMVPHLKERGGGVEAFLEWRREDARLDGSQR